MSTSLDQLRKKAAQIANQVADDPEGRYQLRVAFYRKYGDSWGDGLGLGNSELAFLEWQIKRGVLNPLNDPKQKGSHWWREMNLEFIYQSTLAALVYESGEQFEQLAVPVTHWLNYFKDKTPISWYSAHNASIIQGYLTHFKEAKEESSYEQIFMNIVLYRLMYAQSLVVGVALGEFGSFIADPRFPTVQIIVDIPEFYPDHYPLSKKDIVNILDKGHRPLDFAARVLDDYFIIPELTKLYALAAQWNDSPKLNELLQNGSPAYPVLMKLSKRQEIINRLFRWIAHLKDLIFGKKH